MTVRVRSDDKYLLQLVRLELDGIAEVIGYDEPYVGPCLCLSDARYADAAPTDIRLGDPTDPASLPLPFPLGALAERVATLGRHPARARLTFDGSRVCLDDRPVALTPTEAALFSVLYEAGGAFVPRDELRRRTGMTDGALGVYLHYLRRKLELELPVLEASRAEGYRLRPALLTV